MKPVKIPAFEHFLHEMIPLAKAMGVGVELSDANALVLRAPREQNTNSLNTAFGGSLVSLATLAGYGVVWELMRTEQPAAAAGGAGATGGASSAPAKPQWHIVVKESKAAYRRPVLGDLIAICERPAKAAIAEFKDALARYGKAKMRIRARIIEEGCTAVDFHAAYVVSR
jgi:hypothetical protein